MFGANNKHVFLFVKIFGQQLEEIENGDVFIFYEKTSQKNRQLKKSFFLTQVKGVFECYELDKAKKT